MSRQTIRDHTGRPRALGDRTNRNTFIASKKNDESVVKQTRVLRSRTIVATDENIHAIYRSKRNNYSGTKRKSSAVVGDSTADHGHVGRGAQIEREPSSDGASGGMDARVTRQRRILTRSVAHANAHVDGSGKANHGEQYYEKTRPLKRTNQSQLEHCHPGARAIYKVPRSSSPPVRMDEDSDSAMSVGTYEDGSRSIAVDTVHDQDNGKAALARRIAMIKDPQVPVQYTNDIFKNMCRTECDKMISPDYMDNQADINVRMRMILIDWLIEVHLKFKLTPATLYLTVGYIDRFLAQNSVTRGRLQLVGCSAMLVASKYQEIYPPEVRDFVFISDNAYTREDIIGMESLILNQLKFRLTMVVPFHFVDWYLLVVEASADVRSLTNMLLELSLLEVSMLAYRPSIVAACALYIGVRLSRFSLWTPLMVELTHYSEPQLQDCAREMYNYLVSANPREKAVRKKYAKIDLSRMVRAHTHSYA